MASKSDEKSISDEQIQQIQEEQIRKAFEKCNSLRWYVSLETLDRDEFATEHVINIILVKLPQFMPDINALKDRLTQFHTELGNYAVKIIPDIHKPNNKVLHNLSMFYKHNRTKTYLGIIKIIRSTLLQSNPRYNVDWMYFKKYYDLYKTQQPQDEYVIDEKVRKAFKEFDSNYRYKNVPFISHNTYQHTLALREIIDILVTKSPPNNTFKLPRRLPTDAFPFTIPHQMSYKRIVDEATEEINKYHDDLYSYVLNLYPPGKSREDIFGRLELYRIDDLNNAYTNIIDSAREDFKINPRIDVKWMNPSAHYYLYKKTDDQNTHEEKIKKAFKTIYNDIRFYPPSKQLDKDIYATDAVIYKIEQTDSKRAQWIKDTFVYFSNFHKDLLKYAEKITPDIDSPTNTLRARLKQHRLNEYVKLSKHMIKNYREDLGLTKNVPDNAWLDPKSYYDSYIEYPDESEPGGGSKP